ncbi:hypothetical protein MGG_05881 [Pyricularia oryzae 70-15]|uniref:Heterokaryon incompatibility domain-containing protein n=2 Tax=Pyricularia oryzae TaxID=318829 RepID=G4N3Y0_PYRO7|nr:uncharacterized protein MGG_05881 [Pyricularia oryzae 70-15]EHA51902.1 hypothetical protein MGG_05881 [Pyricularia oryzae 70-15]KAI7917983.1 hypothetical protein M9X92_007126 [Pyricularia oryzae]KAI7919224.1 hypothetical protein M0657_007223 [Pyricularia oryzae]
MPQYEPLVGSDIRLLQLFPLDPGDSGLVECKLVQVPLESVHSKYKALSYVWGDANVTRPISVDGKEVQVNASLEECLRQFCQPGQDDLPYYLWVDAVCINQADLAERSAQVMRMKDIYSTAQEVLIWLGPEREHTRAALACFETMHFESLRIMNRMRDQDNPDEHYFEIVAGQWKTVAMRGADSEEMRGMFDILTRDWFCRVWVLQEVSMAQQATFVCGVLRTDVGNLWAAAMGHVFTLFVDDIVESGWDKLQQNLPIFYDRRALSSLYMLTKMLKWDGCEEYRGRRILQDYDLGGLELFFHVRGLQVLGSLEGMLLELPLQLATDPRDKIYGVLGLSSDFSEGGIVPNYALPVAQIFMDAFASMIKESDSLHLLSGCNFSLLRDSTINEHIPTWVPALWTNNDKDVKKMPIPIMTKIPSSPSRTAHTASGGLALSSHPWNVDLELARLSLSGIVIDSIQRLTKNISLEPNTKEMNDTTYINQLANSRLDELVSDQNLEYPLTGEKAWEAGAATMTANVRKRQDMTGEDTPQSSEPIEQPPLLDKQGDRHVWCLGKDNLMGAVVMDFLSYARLAESCNGWFCLVPKETREGDKIAMLVGGSTFYVLRPQDDAGSGGPGLDKTWQLVGAAYVHGMMDGQALDLGEIDKIVLV